MFIFHLRNKFNVSIPRHSLVLTNSHSTES